MESYIRIVPWTRNILLYVVLDRRKLILLFVIMLKGCVLLKLTTSFPTDHCPCTIIILLDLDPPISIINECACNFKTYDHYDVDKRIRNAINIHRLNLITLEPALNILGENILNKYQDINPSKEMINKLTSELTRSDCRSS